MSNKVFENYLERYETLLKKLLGELDIPAKTLEEAIYYVLFPAGKRLRPLLVYLSGNLFDIDIACLDIIAVAVELTHCYSLVHDDLPAMDNDDYRRGKLSCHRAFSEATAILVGDAIQALAIETILTHLPDLVEANIVILIANELLKAIGPSGMVSGQSLDLSELTNKNISEQELAKIQELKTGKLILACISAVLCIAKPSQEQSQSLFNFATYLGSVFQMHDDYLDIYAPVSLLGKNRASDSANQKLTYANLYSKTELKVMISELYLQAKNSLSIFGSKAHNLHLLIDTLETRG